MKPPVFMLAMVIAILGVTTISTSVSALLKGSVASRAGNVFLKLCVLLGVALLAVAFYMASWGFVFPKK